MRTRLLCITIIFRNDSIAVIIVIGEFVLIFLSKAKALFFSRHLRIVTLSTCISQIEASKDAGTRSQRDFLLRNLHPVRTSKMWRYLFRTDCDKFKDILFERRTASKNALQEQENWLHLLRLTYFCNDKFSCGSCKYSIKYFDKIIFTCARSVENAEKTTFFCINTKNFDLESRTDWRI